MKSKLVEYAYPSSTTATKAGYGNTGCWFVAIYPSVEATIGAIHDGNYFLTKEEATKHADSLPYQYNSMKNYSFDYLNYAK